MANLRETAQKTKEVLSANKERSIELQSLYMDLDFTTKMTREQFELISSDLFDRIAPVVDNVLKISGTPRTELDEFVLVGGSTRIPKIKDILKSSLARDELHQNFNADEGIAFGCALFAANRSVAFHVREMGLIEKMHFSVGIVVTDMVADAAVETAWSKHVSLFSRGSKTETKRHVLLTRENDIVVHMQYDNPDELPTGMESMISTYSITGVSDAFESFRAFGKPKLRLTFEADHNTMISLISGEVIVQEEVPVPVEESKIDVKIDNEKVESTTDKPADVTKAEVKTGKTNTRRAALRIVSGAFGKVKPLSPEDLENSRSKLRDLDAKDMFTQSIDDSRNALEEFLYSASSLLRSSDAIAVSYDGDRAVILKELSEVETELYAEHNTKESPEPYREKLSSLKKMCTRIFGLVDEAKRLPESIEKCMTAIEESKAAVEKLRKSMPWVTNTSIDALENLHDETIVWITEQRALQTNLSPYDDPILLVADIDSRVKSLVKLADQLLRSPKPKPQPPKISVPKTDKTIPSDTPVTTPSDKDSSGGIPYSVEDEPLTGDPDISEGTKDGLPSAASVNVESPVEQPLRTDSESKESLPTDDSIVEAPKLEL